MSSFFLPSKGSTKHRKNSKIKTSKKKRGDSSTEQKLRQKPSDLDEEIASESDTEDLSTSKRKRDLHDDQELEETVQEKRLRLAKDYLSQLEEEKEGEDGDADYDAISHRLRQDVLEQAGKLQRKVADQYAAAGVDVNAIRVFKGHQLPVTCVAMTPDDKYIYSGSKDCCIIKWEVESGKKVVIFPGHRKGVEGVIGHQGHVIALAVSSDGKYLASGGQDKVIHIWDVRTSVHLHTFRGHRDTISGLVFQRGTHELFSCSFDRTVKIWNLDEMAYVETLFGHQDGISSIDCLSRERPLTSGMNDNTVRLWKVVEESQLVFHGHKSSIDSVRLINEECFVSGSQDGSIALWNMMKKKPLVSCPHTGQAYSPAHSTDSLSSEHWVTAVAALPNTDLVASGSNSGQVCLWKCGDGFRSLNPCLTIPLTGFVNSLVFSSSGGCLVAGVGQEHRFGRWWRHRNCKNSVVLIPLLASSKTL